MSKFQSELLDIEECFEKIKMQRDVNGSLRQITRILVRMFQQDFEVVISDNKTNEFFGMAVYPSEETCEKLIDALVVEQSNIRSILTTWEKNSKWYIEVDSFLLYDSHLNASPKEMVAILLHEIGHTIYANTVPTRLFKVVRMELTKTRMMTRELLKNKKLRTLFFPTVTNACAYKSFSFLSELEEKDADKFVVTMGYGDSLNSFLNKLLTTQGNDLIERTDREAEQDTAIMCKWSIENIEELKSRKDKLKSQLNGQILHSPSVYCRNMFASLKKIFFNTNNDSTNTRGTALVSEAFLNIQINEAIDKSWDFAMKSAERSIVQEFTFGSLKKVKKVDRADLDYIFIKSEEIQTYEDKIYLLDLIYYHREQVELALQYIEEGNQSKVSNSKIELVDMQKQLEFLRNKVLKQKLKEPKYGLFVKYPTGYEG